MVIHGTSDVIVRQDQADLIKEWCTAHPNEDKVSVKYAQGGHHSFSDLTHEELVTSEMIAFLKALINEKPVKKFGLTDVHTFFHGKIGNKLTNRLFDYAPGLE